MNNVCQTTNVHNILGHTKSPMRYTGMITNAKMLEKFSYFDSLTTKPSTSQNIS
jgi:hypothetical protein